MTEFVKKKIIKHRITSGLQTCSMEDCLIDTYATTASILQEKVRFGSLFGENVQSQRFVPAPVKLKPSPLGTFMFFSFPKCEPSNHQAANLHLVQNLSTWKLAMYLVTNMYKWTSIQRECCKLGCSKMQWAINNTIHSTRNKKVSTWQPTTIRKNYR